MKANALAAAKERLDYAREEASKCVSGPGHAVLAKHWVSFLVFSNQFFNKLKAGAKSDPARTWFEGVEKTRGDDDLLSYVLHARHAAEHGLGIVTQRVRRKFMGVAFHPDSIRLLVVPEATVMLPVRSRPERGRPGKLHYPRAHLGRPVNIATPNLNHAPTFLALEAGAMEHPEPFRDVANLAVAYMEKTLREAECE